MDSEGQEAERCSTQLRGSIWNYIYPDVPKARGVLPLQSIQLYSVYNMVRYIQYSA